ncbi:uncharacterized protein UDID_19587 [Ustilago sp. UG-2017a]|nr:uncharacterized protein UDID_19587 [Ustilago sp. UG-2017a]
MDLTLIFSSASPLDLALVVIANRAFDTNIISIIIVIIIIAATPLSRSLRHYHPHHHHLVQDNLSPHCHRDIPSSSQGSTIITFFTFHQHLSLWHLLTIPNASNPWRTRFVPYSLLSMLATLKNRSMTVLQLDKGSDPKNQRPSLASEATWSHS